MICDPFDPTPYPRTPRQQQLCERARALAARFGERAAEHDRDGSFPHANFADLRTAGFAGLTVPESLGGDGADLLEMVMVLEELGRGDGSTALAFTMHAQTVGHAVESGAWPEPLFARLCREAVERGALVNSVATEPELGSPARGGRPKTTARPVRDRSGSVVAWQMSGRKSFASMAPTLDYAIVPATLEGTNYETARFLVPMAGGEGAGISIVETWDSLGMRATGSHDLVLRDVNVPAGMMVERVAEGASARNAPVNAWFMLGVSAVYLGVAEAALTCGCDYALARVPTALGKPIAEVEAIQRQLGQASFLLQQARLALYQAAALWQDNSPPTNTLSNLVAVAKVTATNNAIGAVDLVMRAAGGSAMSRSLPLERYYRDVRGGLYHPINDDAAYVGFGKSAIAASRAASEAARMSKENSL